MRRSAPTRARATTFATAVLASLSLTTATGATAAPSAPIGAAALPPAERALAREIYAELVGTPTTQRTGTTVAAEALARRFLEAGYAAADVAIVGPVPRSRTSS